MATPKLALIPTGYKAGKLYSVLPESGVGDFTVVRATEATRVNEEGLIETMGANVPRLDYSGGGCPVLLTEPQRTNRITHSEDFSNAAWSKVNSNITINNQISPDGTLNASLMASTSAGSYISDSLATYNPSDFSIFVKYIDQQFVQLYSGASGNFYATFDIQNQVIGASGAWTSNLKIENYGNNWYRISCVFTGAAVGSSVRIGFAQSLTSTWGGLNTSFGTSLLLYGAMFENGSYPTSYIKTEGSAVTRNADQVYGAGDAATFNDSEGVLMVETSALAKDGTNRYISISDGSDANRLYLRYRASNNVFSGSVVVNNALQVLFDTTDDNILNFSKFLLKYKENDFEFWLNGFKLLVDTSGSTFPNGTLNQLRFDTGGTGVPFYGNTKQVQYFNTVLTDSELETLTSWTSFIEMAQAQNYNII